VPRRRLRWNHSRRIRSDGRPPLPRNRRGGRPPLRAQLNCSSGRPPRRSARRRGAKPTRRLSISNSCAGRNNTATRGSDPLATNILHRRACCPVIAGPPQAEPEIYAALHALSAWGWGGSSRQEAFAHAAPCGDALMEWAPGGTAPGLPKSGGVGRGSRKSYGRITAGPRIGTVGLSRACRIVAATVFLAEAGSAPAWMKRAIERGTR